MHLDKIYIAGPMRKIRHLNFPAFDKAEAQLRDDGWDVINPAELYRIGSGKPTDWLPEPYPDDHLLGWSLTETILADLERIVRECTAIFMLRGWSVSLGATAEKAVAEWAELRVIEQSDYEVGKAFASHPFPLIGQ